MGIYVTSNLEKEIWICRGNEECQGWTELTAGSLLTGGQITDKLDSPTGRMSMKRSGMRMGTTSYRGRPMKKICGDGQ